MTTGCGLSPKTLFLGTLLFVLAADCAVVLTMPVMHQLLALVLLAVVPGFLILVAL